MKKFLALMMALVLSLSLVACGGGDDKEKDQDDDQAGTAAELNVGVFWFTFSDPYLTTVRTAMHDELEAIGAKYQDYDAGNVQATQIDQVNTALNDGANLLVVNIVETSSSDSAKQICDLAKAVDVPVIFFNREVADDVINGYENCAFVGTDADAAGHMQGEMIASYLLENYEEADLNGDGVISYVMFKGQEANKEAEARTKYSVEDANKKLTEAGKPELKFFDEKNASKYLVDPNGAWSNQAATDYMQSILAAYTEENHNMIELVIANNDGMAEGAIAALQQAGYNTGEEGSTTIPVYGVDAMATALQKIEKGQMTGTAKQDGPLMAKTIVELAKNVADGEALMANTDEYDIKEGVAKILLPYFEVTGK